ncbi:MAG: hypothetical protein A3E82_07145 [Gammaproteobacteria bacterium RIFCSPHIGHO2_12_FULL_38_11]|nr:MAG: hypothetical protein A3E82_07145 [Gammaproteobacteria bacterium RIFCSPHIGHO2_12_FULL_38_11]
MKKFNSVLTIVLTSTALTISNTAAAADIFAPLENFITTFYNNQAYPTAVTFSTPKTINTATIPATKTTPALPVTRAASAAAQQATSANLQNSLLQFFYALHANDKPGTSPKLKNTIKTAEGTDFSTYFTNNSIASLTTSPPAKPAITKDNPGTQASDTLYFSNPTGVYSTLTSNKKPSQADIKLVTKPTIINNNFLDYAAFFTPMAYTQAQTVDASNFIKYAAQSTRNLTSGVNFNILSTNPIALPAVVTSPEYYDYMFMVRSLLAVRSISINMLNHIRFERTPMPSLGKAAGLTTDAASPLQVESYQANHRITDKTWYTQITNATPATVQRETLIVLAEIEQQNFQAHLDRERLLAAITALNLTSSNQAMSAALQEKATKLNDLIGRETKTKAH